MFISVPVIEGLVSPCKEAWPFNNIDQDIAKVLNYPTEKGASFVSISFSRESAACVINLSQ